MPVIKDSGERRDFETGAVRDIQSGKGRYDLIPYEPLRRLAVIFEKGAEKYGVCNWQKGIPVSSFIDSAMRHLQKAAHGVEDGEDHAAMAAWNVFCMMWTLDKIETKYLPAALDDRIDKKDLISTTFSASASSCRHDFTVEEYTDSSGTHVTEHCQKCGCYRQRLRNPIY